MSSPLRLQLVRSNSRYYQVMTRFRRMPVFIDDGI
jgi:hypothetical protein